LSSDFIKKLVDAAGQLNQQRRSSIQPAEVQRIVQTQPEAAVAMGAQSYVCIPSLDDFHFIAVLGKGNFGKVMLAEEKASKNLYAIKVLKKEFILENDEIESTKAEKRVFCAINRGRIPFLVGLHSCFQTETRIYFVMEYISGGDLMLHIQRQQFSEKRARYYACEVLLALEYFHKNNIVYRCDW
jgi:serine/threonine protein kinase